jgi:NAD(P)-dependent dehydrogenase (short-subunit alcohol dehydrogenase family)
MPGFALAKLAAEVAEQHPEAEGLLLLQHGLFTWGATARESYERHIRAVDEAERWLNSCRAELGPSPTRASVSWPSFAAELRGRLGEGVRRYFYAVRESEAIQRFVAREDLGSVSQRGPVTPDHIIRTKAVPLILDLRNVEPTAHVAAIEAALAKFRTEYRAYFARQAQLRPERQLTALDPDPRVVLLPGAGALIGLGNSPKAASVAADLYEHTIDVIEAAEAVGRYQALPESDLFDMEYWSLEQAKLGKQRPRPLEGQIVYISGAAQGIGAATARVFHSAGATLYLVDRDGEALATIARELRAASEVLELAEESMVRRSIHNCMRTYGGLDGLVSNAGFAPQTAIARCSTELLAGSFAINFYAHHWLASEAYTLFERQRMGGFLLFNASKAAFNPGPGFGPYALPKAALVALTKQYALEGGALGIRANAVNADRVRTNLMSADEIERRAAARGLDPDAYFRSNLLQREVTARDVAEAFLHLALAPSTTGCVLTVDGGNIAASPR